MFYIRTKRKRKGQMKEFASETGKYKCTIDDDESIKGGIFINGIEDKNYIKYENVTLTNILTNSVIFQFKQYTPSGLDSMFFKQGDVEWFLGSLEYMSQIFVNLETGEYYDNSERCINDLKDNGYEKKYGIFEPSDGFIWCDKKSYIKWLNDCS